MVNTALDRPPISSYLSRYPGVGDRNKSGGGERRQRIGASMVETTTLADDDLLSGSEQIAEFVHLSHRHAQALLRSGALPGFRHGKRGAWRMRKSVSLYLARVAESMC